MIIIEGTDCCFKTTVADKLSKQLGFPVVKGSSFELSSCTNEELFQHFKELAKLEDVIIDRFIYSNRVYATLYRDFAILTHDQRKEIEETLKGKAAIYYLHADDEVIKSRINERGDEYVDTSMVSSINKEYIRTMNEARIKKFSYDTGDWTSNEIVKDIAHLY